jgi:hypothetical protein
MPLYVALNVPLNAVALREAKLTVPDPRVAVNGVFVVRVPHSPLPSLVPPPVMPQLLTVGCSEPLATRFMVYGVMASVGNRTPTQSPPVSGPHIGPAASPA